jgi:hypothetical protein
VAEYSQIDKQVPHKVVVSKTLLGVEDCTERVEDSARTNQRKKWGRGLFPKEREEDYNHPDNNEVNGKAY